MTDREKLIELIECEENGIYHTIAVLTADWLISNGVTIPVRCKDCRYRIHDKVTNEWFCNSIHSGFVYAKANDFCSYGERRTDE